MRRTRKYLVAAVLVALRLGTTAAHAADENAPSETIIIASPEDYADTPWAKLNIPAGTKLITSQAGGKKLRRLEFAGGVSFSELEDGSTVSIDRGKGGAILCSWGLYAAIKNNLDKCHPEETELRRHLELAIEKIETFIVANSLTPVTKAQLKIDLQGLLGQAPDQCRGDMSGMTQHFISRKAELLETFQKSVDDYLATPRPPVINPCL